MPPIILAPGPTKVHPELMQWMNDADAEGVFWRSHRTPWFESMFAEVKQGLRSLLSIPEGHTIALLTSANEAWERSIESLVKQESFHLVGVNLEKDGSNMQSDWAELHHDGNTIRPFPATSVK